MTNSPPLSFKNVTVRYAAGSQPAVADVTFTVAPGERVGLLGLNGSGKTSLLLAAVGLVNFSGEITTAGLAVVPKNLRRVRDNVGFLFGTPDDQILFPNVLHDVAFTLERRGVPRREAREQAQQALVALGAGHLAEMAPHRLSVGQRQRVALAASLVSRPQVVLLDEPSSALDPVGREELAQLLGRQQVSLLMATHDLPFARRVCHRFVMLEGGRVVIETTNINVIEEYQEQQIAQIVEASGVYFATRVSS
ncbi:MAG: ABC transporter ATP-binding protein [Lentisphaerae bacterium]|jgi:energy-coupling factor transporter ATP-binding protein EcfA2|nr:ABC transporter ATP-binding protein [Lentisphaerota bacterium]